MIKGSTGLCNGCRKKKVIFAKDLCRVCYDSKNKDIINKNHSIWRKQYPNKVKKSMDKYRFSGNRIESLKRDSFECQRCGTNQEQSIMLFGSSLIVHHIDGYGRDEKKPNNKLDNLITVCWRCHQTIHKEMRDAGIITKDKRGSKK